MGSIYAPSHLNIFLQQMVNSVENIIQHHFGVYITQIK